MSKIDLLYRQALAKSKSNFEPKLFADLILDECIWLITKDTQVPVHVQNILKDRIRRYFT